MAGTLGFVDPADIARQILTQRELIATEWAQALHTRAPVALQALLAADLEQQLGTFVDDATGSDGLQRRVDDLGLG